MRLALLAIGTIFAAVLAPSQTAAQLQQQLRGLTLNPEDSYRVRDLRLRRGDVTLYLNEGVLAFAKPIQGRRLAAVFTTSQSEAGDAEIVAIPGKASERLSLASSTGNAALDEHIGSAVLFFSDSTAEDLMKQIEATPTRSASSIIGELSSRFERLVAQPGGMIEDALIASLLDRHLRENGLFVAALFGRRLGAFHLIYNPMASESVMLGRLGRGTPAGSPFQLWAAYSPSSDLAASSLNMAAHAIKNYQLDVSLDTNLAMRTRARFVYRASATDGRVVRLSLSPRLVVQSATIDGQPAEVFQSPNTSTAESLTGTEDASILLIARAPLAAEQNYSLNLDYSGTIIERRPYNSFYVTDRATWYPHLEATAAAFDLTFHYPAAYTLVATGTRVEPDTELAQIRTLHTRTSVPEQLAGFNIGRYSESSGNTALYHVDCFAERPATCTENGILSQGSAVLSYYTRRWMPLSTRSLSITPIPGSFGQGFPGLIYLANLSFLISKDRPLQFRDNRSDLFFSHELLPHEIAHQWWGNLVTASSYRSAWLMEAMASYAALQFLEQTENADTARSTLIRFRDELLLEKDGRTIESYGPLDLGERLLANSGEEVWHTIIYEKGAWVLHMLRLVLGDKPFREFQISLLRRYAGQTIENEQVREAASHFVPAGTPDRSFRKFFDTWVYGTGIPVLQLHRSGAKATLKVAGVGDDFTADLPLRCKSNRGHTATRWISIVAGENVVSSEADQETCELPSPTEYLYRP